MLVAGAAWTAKADSPQDTGRQPLAVEAVTATHAAELIPGVITTTPHARYLSLHARAALEAQRRGWSTTSDQTAFRGLLRCAEVVLSAISVRHATTDQDDHQRRAGTRGPHGVNAVKRWWLDHASLDIVDVAQVYSDAVEGFYGTYGGIESALGLIRPGDVPSPGPAADPADLSALDGIIELATQPRPLSTADLDGLADLCLCQVGTAPDGRCLRRAYFDPGTDGGEMAGTHRRSAGVLITALDGQPISDNVDVLMDRLCCFTPDLAAVIPDPDLAQHALRWRGVLLRNWSVWAWRLLWACLVDPLRIPATRSDAVEKFTADLPRVTVRQALVDELPPMTGPGGTLLPAEHDLWKDAQVAGTWSVLQLLRLLAVGARRIDDLDEISREAFLRYDMPGMGPTWVRSWLDRMALRPLVDAAAELADELFARAEMVSRQKMQWTPRGLRMPTRLRTVGDRLWLEGREGDGSASLRLEMFTTMLHQLGVLAFSADSTRWTRGPHQPRAAS